MITIIGTTWDTFYGPTSEAKGPSADTIRQCLLARSWDCDVIPENGGYSNLPFYTETREEFFAFIRAVDDTR